MKNAPALVLVLLLLASCKANRHTVKDFEQKAKSHKLIAIMPVKIIYTGSDEESFGGEEFTNIISWERFAFQQGLYKELTSLNGDLKIEIQPPDTFNSKLFLEDVLFNSDNNVSHTQICTAVKCDAIVYINIMKERLLAADDSISLAGRLPLTTIQKVNPPQSPLNQNKPQIPGNAARSYRIKAHSTLINGTDNTILWEYTFETEAAWDDPAWTVINKVCKGMAKKFPYRNGPYGAN